MPRPLQDRNIAKLEEPSEKRRSVEEGGPSVACKTTTMQLADTAMDIREMSKKIGHAHVKWDSPPHTALIVTKPGDRNLVRLTRELTGWLIETPRYGHPTGLIVYVDAKLQSSQRFRHRRYPTDEGEDMLRFWTPELCASKPHLFDLIITLGGDGTVLFTSWLFQNHVPPVISFHLGSLGFLTPFDFASYRDELDAILKDDVSVTFRTRLTCTIYRAVDGAENGDAAPTAKSRTVKKNKRKGKVESQPDDTPRHRTVATETFTVLNDLVVDRGPSSYMSLLELFADDLHLTTVQADGLCIATPTGSTAYSLSSGGPLTHPEVPALLVSPICPHTLSFRPVLVPDSVELRVCVPPGSRAVAWASFDGRGRVELRRGDHVKVVASRWGFPTVCKREVSGDWFGSLQRCLGWNQRQRQKSFAVVEEGRARVAPKAPTCNDRAIGSPTEEENAKELEKDLIHGMFAMYDDEEASATSSGSSSFVDEGYDDDALEGWAEDELKKGRLMVPKSLQSLVADGMVM
ncbi:hypothetical protein BC937DRAFT_87728 [Endogone sp. FLAS-F59071]|nr:hypothetical protein BC937DRAFT_87728 [Endogone sp. FLAS-F59071]RUS19284.1 hypothetical protein BC937DRAFT_87728 [Endogone sp. FLAS-F59071]|eukprot:RUS19283.1 hypothetical protein BC937DRAFT_87728 [Endogone sp. FLAS-F59071]